MLLHYDTGFDTAAAVLCAIFFLYAKRSKRTRTTVQKRVFNILLINIILTSLVNIVATAAEQLHLCSGLPLTIMTTIYYLLHTSIIAIFALYVMCLNSSLYLRTRLDIFIFSLPLWASYIFILTNLRTGYIFYYSDGVYYRNHMFVILIVPLLYLIALIGNTFVYRKLLLKRQLSSLIFCLIIGFGGFTVDVFAPWLQIEMLTIAFGAMDLMLRVESYEGNFDQSSLLLNRTAFTNRLKQLYFLSSKRKRSHLHKVPYTFRCLKLQLVNADRLFSTLPSQERQKFISELAEWMIRNLSGLYICYYRFAIDTVVCLLPSSKQEETEQWILDRLKKELQRKVFYFNHYHFRIQLQATAFNLPEDAADPDSLIALLNLDPPSSEKTDLRISKPEEIAKLRHSLEIERCIHRVLENDSIQVYYQPIWDSLTDSIIACEALMRVFDDELGFVPPDELIPVAERIGCVHEIDSAVLRKVCRFLRDKDPCRYGLRYVEVNLSLAQMLSPDLIDTYQNTLREYGIPIRRINIEITETVDAEKSECFQDVQKRLTDADFSLSLDDFGTEYSNMNRLFTTKFENIKIDKSLLWKAEGDETIRQLLAQITQMLRRMGCNALQEGVESKEQLDFVTGCGCNLVQGYYFSKPLPENEFLEYLRSYNDKNKTTA